MPEPTIWRCPKHGLLEPHKHVQEWGAGEPGEYGHCPILEDEDTGCGRRMEPIQAASADPVKDLIGRAWEASVALEGHGIEPVLQKRLDAALKACADRPAIRKSEGADGHRLKLDFDGGLRVTLIHPDDGCRPPSQCARCAADLTDPEAKRCYDCKDIDPTKEECWLTSWVDEQGDELIRGSITLPADVTWETDYPLFHLQTLPSIPLEQGSGELAVDWPDTEPAEGKRTERFVLAVEYEVWDEAGIDRQQLLDALFESAPVIVPDSKGDEGAQLQQIETEQEPAASSNQGEGQ